MAITSIGYDGTVDEVAWAKLHPAASTRPSMVSGGAPTIVTGSARTMRVAAGEFYAWGVYVTTDASVDVVAPSISSGTRWDTLVLRRDWGSNTSSFLILAGTSTKAVSASVQTNKGVLADQVLGLVLLDSTQTAVQQFVDLREWAGSLIVRPQINEWPDANQYPYGQTLVQYDALSADFALRRGAAPNAYWDKMLARPWADLSMSGNVAAGNLAQYRVVGDCLELRGLVQPSGGGSFGSSFLTVATLPSSLRPQVGGQFAVGAGGLSATTLHALLQVRSATDGGTIEVKTSGTSVTYIRLDGVRISLT